MWTRYTDVKLGFDGLYNGVLGWVILGQVEHIRLEGAVVSCTIYHSPRLHCLLLPCVLSCVPLSRWALSMVKVDLT